MKNATLALVAAAALSIAGGELLAQQGRLSPVTRVVELLQNLGKKVEEELKAEQELFQHFECWAKSVISQKTAANAEAASRKQSLETYVADLDAGRIELTTERVDLEKEISGLSADIDEATALRTKENDDFVAAKAEMEQAVTALEQAIAVLADGGQPAGQQGGGALLRLRAAAGTVEGGVAALEADARSVSLLLDIAGRSLSKGDALFLRRVLTGEVPVKDWKKLNRKATFKNKYEARSGNIQKTLKSLLETFQDSLAEAESKEGKAAGLHTTLMGSKQDQKMKAQDALSAMEVEGAARGLSRSEAASEIEALGTQITDDTQYMADTQAALDTKSSEWADRNQIRTDEVEAISKAISILHSDDARDVMKKSLKSQGYSLVQGARHVVARAVQVQSAAAAGRFDKVIESIDKMADVLKDEETADLKRKEGCEKARAEDTRQAAVISRAMDELTDTITRLHSEIEELDGQIKEKKSDIAAIEEQLSDAKRNREDEHREWTTSDAEDRDAASLVGEAVSVLETFYAKVAFTQRQSRGSAGRQPVEGMAAGQAPPPPPATWAAPYGGKQDANTGVVSILSLIKEDIEKDRAKATQEEDASKQAYGRFKQENEGQIQALQGSIIELQGVVGDKEGEVQNNSQDRLSKRSELEAVMAKIKAAAPGCNFFAVNYHVRLESRQVELDGLHQAKQVLQGASFK